MPSGGFVHHLLRARDWQDRPEFGELCRWWKEGGIGVCALVGIGGAGKTAIAERFLQVLPGGYPEHPKVGKDQSLAAPARLLVFSFYDAPNPDTFFTTLAAWLEGRPLEPGVEAAENRATRPPSYYQTLELLASAGKCLLVLDGLEKVQDDGGRGGAFGQILDGRLRDFVVRAADGYLPQMSLVITSRFRLYDPLASRVWYYRQVDVERLQPPSAVQLLRDRGVRGTEEELECVAREQGFHALSIDLVGGYITHFCDGDPGRFSALALERLEPVDVADSALNLDPRIASIREQERKFARLTESYHQALGMSDPAALALLQRVCLFRLGVDTKTLASIFTGKSKKKQKISGTDLARLNEQQLQARLQLLVEMRLIEGSDSQVRGYPSQIYTVHPSVREGFLKKLDARAARLGHHAVRKGLAASLSGKPGDNPSDPATLDLLEEIVFHTLATGHPNEAFSIYSDRIGGYKNLGWRLGAYERGERICRTFATGQARQAASLPAELTKASQGVLFNAWALYLKDLGQLSKAVRYFERSIALSVEQEYLVGVSFGNINLAEADMLAGHLTVARRAGEEALRNAELSSSPASLRNSYAMLAHVLAHLGETKFSLEIFLAALQVHHSYFGQTDLPLYAHQGLCYASLLRLLGRNEIAVQITEINKAIQIENKHGSELAGCNLLLADCAREQGNLPLASELLHEVQEWALQRDAKETLCWSALVRAKRELATFSDQSAVNQSNARTHLQHAASALEDGLRFARECGYGIYHIDLLVARAQLALLEGRASDAERDVRVALDEGDHPPADSGYPELLAATDPECLYAWGIVEGRHLLGEALLLQAAQKLGQAEFVPKRLDRLPAEVRDLIDRGREQLGEALELWRKLRDPESEADINPHGERTRREIEQLDGGVLTEYPLKPTAPGEPAELSESSEPDKANKETKAVSKKYVFLSYGRDNKAEVAKLHSELIAAGEAVWWDQDILPGQDWKLEIRKAMRNAYAVVLCLSQETAARTTSGIYPEALDAIAAYREYSPGSTFLIPVRLSDCEVPPIEIDGTRTLDRLQFVDLFPLSERTDGLTRLVRSLQAAPHHP